MIYNARFNYLFVHIQKTAGTSMTNFLLSRPDSYYINPPHLRLCDLSFKGSMRPTIFTVIRNPWERLVSWYEMMKRKGFHNDFSRYLLDPITSNESGTEVSFSEFIRRIDVISETSNSESRYQIQGAPLSIMQDWPFDFKNQLPYTKSLSYNQLDYLCSESNELLCDTVLRFDQLEHQWPIFYQQFEESLPDYRLPRLNASPQGYPAWQSYYQNPDDIAWVQALYQKDIDYFAWSYRV